MLSGKHSLQRLTVRVVLSLVERWTLSQLLLQAHLHHQIQISVTVDWLLTDSGGGYLWQDSISKCCGILLFCSAATACRGTGLVVVLQLPSWFCGGNQVGWLKWSANICYSFTGGQPMAAVSDLAPILTHMHTQPLLIGGNWGTG